MSFEQLSIILNATFDCIQIVNNVLPTLGTTSRESFFGKKMNGYSYFNTYCLENIRWIKKETRLVEKRFGFTIKLFDKIANPYLFKI